MAMAAILKLPFMMKFNKDIVTISKDSSKSYAKLQNIFCQESQNWNSVVNRDHFELNATTEGKYRVKIIREQTVYTATKILKISKKTNISQIGKVL